MDEMKATRVSLEVEYTIEDGWYVGNLKAIPAVVTQGESLEELQINLVDATLGMLAVATGMGNEPLRGQVESRGEPKPDTPAPASRAASRAANP